MHRRNILKSFAAAGALTVLGACAQQEPSNTVVDIAADNPQFSTLVTAIQAAGLEDTLRGEGPFTVFAPTNAAFDALPEGTLETLLQPENRDQLASILTYHVVPGAITSDQLVGQRMDVATVNGETVLIDGTGGKARAAVTVNGAAVTDADILASNGVIHVIDEVLLP
ncbi:MAG: fasciclin domain-containing protein [Roseovarius sp.]